MKVLIVVHQSLPRWLGGAEVYAHQLAQALNKRGHSAVLFTREEGGSGLERTAWEGVTIYRCHTAPMSDTDKFRAVFGHPLIEAAFARVLAEARPDVVHFHHLLGLSPRIFWQATEMGLPTVLTIQDYWYVCANTKLLTNDSEQLCRGPQAWLNCARCGAAKLGSAARWIAPALAPAFAARDLALRRILNRADVLIAPSAFLRDTYIRLGAPRERTRMIEGGIHLPPVPPTPLREHGPLRVLFVGSLLPLKGAHILVEAFNTLPPEAELALIGDPRRDPDYARHLRALARHPGIHWLGPASREDVWPWYQWADVVAVPSLWYENAPLVIQEALAMQRPVIASRVGALPEWVRDDIDGELFSPGDAQALGAALRRIAEQREIIRHWQRHIRPVRTMQAMAEDMETVYRELVAARPA
jgi:glycosyltransferase involved in cell wall biosynthesis